MGKTHLAIAITMAMVALHQVCPLFPATTLVKVLQKLDRYSLMVIDDMSYVRCSELESSVMVELICHRYERKSLLVTSTQPFREWDNNFPNGSMTVAAVERLVHNCHIIDIKGRATGRRQLLQEFPVIRATGQRH